MDAKWMLRAMELAERGRGWVHPNPLVGAVLVKEGRLIGEGYHRRFGLAHAEREALSSCLESAQGATLYVTLEPCSHHGKTPPCVDAIIEAGIKKVVVGMIDPNPLVAGRGVKRLRASGIQVEVGVLEKDLRRQNRLFLSAMEKNRPRVLLKAAMSLDGKLATKTGESKWITSGAARKRVHLYRHQWPAILVGIGTVLADNPSLTARSEEATFHQPLRVVLDRQARTPTDARIITEKGGETLICVGPRARSQAVKALERAGALVLPLPERENGLCLDALMKALFERGIDGLLVEGGSRVHGAFVDAGLVDEVAFFMAPKIIGGETAPSVVGGKGTASLDEVLLLDNLETTHLGRDLLIEGQIEGM